MACSFHLWFSSDKSTGKPGYKFCRSHQSLGIDWDLRHSFAGSSNCATVTGSLIIPTDNTTVKLQSVVTCLAKGLYVVPEFRRLNYCSILQIWLRSPPTTAHLRCQAEKVFYYCVRLNLETHCTSVNPQTDLLPKIARLGFESSFQYLILLGQYCYTRNRVIVNLRWS
jgi:hypothetical protein